MDGLIFSPSLAAVISGEWTDGRGAAERALPVASGGSSFAASLSPMDVLVIRVRFAAV